MTYLLIKNLHMLAALVALTGFILRGYWMMTGSDRLQYRLVRIAPHIVDTVLLASGITLIWLLHLNAFSQPWLLAKFAGLIAYIVLGTFAIKRGATMRIRIIAFVGAIAVFTYMIGVAVTKSPASWLTILP